MKNTLFSARNRAIFGLFLCAFLMCGFSFAQVNVTPAPFVESQYFNGTLPCNGCLLYTYAAGTTTPLVSYTDSTGVTPNADPVVLDSNGYPSSSGTKVCVCLGPSAYKLVLKTSAGVTIWTFDGAYGWYASFLALNGGNALTAIADPAASLGKFWLSSTLAGRIKWSDASAIHTVVGADTTDTLTNKTIAAGNFTGTETHSGQIQSSIVTGTPPFSIASTTPVSNLTVSNHPKVYNCGVAAACANTALPNSMVVIGTVALISAAPSAVTVTGISPAFTAGATYVCTATNNTTAANPVKVTNVSGSSFTITGPNTVTDSVTYICVGS